MGDIKEHKRVNDIFLGPLERPALQWLAAHMPAWASPDLMTVIGIIGALVITLGYGLSNFHPAYLWLCTLGFIINWVGDSLDGTLARYRHIERPKYGFYIDHITDVLTEIIIIVGMGLSPYIKFSVAAMCCITYIAMSVMVYVRMNVMGEFKISYGKLGPTEVRLLAILLNTAMFFGGKYTFKLPLGPLSASVSPYDLFVIFISLLLVYFFADTSIKQSIELRKLGE
ncbi:MAG TPA: CDP-alcohol phosphatidyltransferase family protein [Anaerolineales bacterium]|nr:CDP-alcohol phosphatidyltransferase family protein [Anaerolineales bacterium]